MRDLNPYPAEVSEEGYDDGTMPNNVDALATEVVGHRIVRAEKAEGKDRYGFTTTGMILALDDGRRVALIDTHDCCAYTALEEFLLHPDRVEHVITGVGTTGDFTKWHIYADMGDVLELTVGWSCGNPFYYGYGFDIVVQDLPEIDARVIAPKQLGVSGA